MNSFRTEISIPVNKDSRTFEERNNDMYDKLQEKYSQQNTSDNSKVVIQEPTNKVRDTNHDSFFDTDRFFKTDINDFDHNVSSWLSNSRRKWNEEMSALKDSMFSLESNQDEFDFDSWDPWKNRPRRDDFIFHGAVTSSPIGNQNLRETKESGFVSSSTPMNYNDTVTRFKNDMKPVYEVGPDGELYFKLRLESKNFKPEDIKVSCYDSNLTINAKNSELPDSDPNSELEKSIFVPRCVNAQKFQCHLTEDGILILEAPVMSPEYTSLLQRQSKYYQIPDKITFMKIKSSTGPVVLCDERGKRIRLEVLVDHDYLPGDFSVTTETNKICVKGRHEVQTCRSTSFKEFSRSYEVLEKIDPMSVTFKLGEGVLIIEAMIV